MSLVGLSCWACGIASWFFGRLVASFLASSEPFRHWAWYSVVSRSIIVGLGFIIKSIKIARALDLRHLTTLYL
ncbi:hypothetical protein C2G38_2176173 [Gigaspora rosea]|uniref:Uncharacterized protein n=1 Tax=Gigaspora rosea TaxID=44941 RepID=A0A397VIC7_9GLOM|nr:hypothetical protein C2G38_2176173 [Gigaspora rosea]